MTPEEFTRLVSNGGTGAGVVLENIARNTEGHMNSQDDRLVKAMEKIAERLLVILVLLVGIFFVLCTIAVNTAHADTRGLTPGRVLTVRDCHPRHVRAYYHGHRLPVTDVTGVTVLWKVPGQSSRLQYERDRQTFWNASGATVRVRWSCS